MASETPTYIERIQACEAAIGRIRAAIRSGSGDAESVGEDWERIRQVVEPRFVWYARSLRRISPAAMEEALEALYDRLLDDIWNLNYPSLEWGFGAYLRTVPLRALQRVERNYRAPGVSNVVEHLDETVGEDGVSRHEFIEDAQAEHPFAAIGEQEELQAAIARLPGVDRHVLLLRLQEVDNGEIARRLGVSPATATRIYQRAVAQLRASLNPPQE